MADVKKVPCSGYSRSAGMIRGDLAGTWIEMPENIWISLGKLRSE
jgi:hypothetical protein